MSNNGVHDVCTYDDEMFAVFVEGEKVVQAGKVTRFGNEYEHRDGAFWPTDSQHEYKRYGYPTLVFSDGTQEIDTVEECVSPYASIAWDAERAAYPNEIAHVYSYPGDYAEIGKAVNGVWCRAGSIDDITISCQRKGYFGYLITWDKAFKHLPEFYILDSALPEVALAFHAEFSPEARAKRRASREP